MAFDARPLLVVALGGNALSPPAGEPSYAAERTVIATTCDELAQAVTAGYRLLIVHGNGPQVGRLMRDDLGGENLDIYVAQTQGELGYLLTAGLAHAGVSNSTALVTRVRVDVDDPDAAEPVKAVGPELAVEPTVQPSRRSGSGWRVLVGSPNPLAVLEIDAIRLLSGHSHVIAGGGGGVPVSEQGAAVQGVVDKDWVAAMLAVQLDASALLFVTDVDGVHTDHGSTEERLIAELDIPSARALHATGSLGAGSMAPKVMSAVQFAEALGRHAHIVRLGQIMPALSGQATGTHILPSP
jgi:carbamate kinase